ncbi:MAG: amidohydrolase family protein [Chitinophagaceae bacterium]|nr:amidohydrolase family protein [Chitinophagaceae bacterium]
MLFSIPVLSSGQIIKFENSSWWIDGKFRKINIYSVNGEFAKSFNGRVDTTIDLKNSYCIPPFGDAHTHNLDGGYRLKETIESYLEEGVFYIQVLGNHGKAVARTRTALASLNKIEVRYANGVLTSTYGHGFYPFEPLAMGIYAPYLQIKFADSIKKSRLVENDAYYFLDNPDDVDLKWQLIMRYAPDLIKICLNDCVNYIEKRKKAIADDNGLSREVAAHVVKKAHAEGKRVIAHVETAEDARICATIGVDGLAHLPGYYWDGTEQKRKKYCMTRRDVKLFKQSGLSIIPTVNINGTTKFDTAGKPVVHADRYKLKIKYQKKMLRLLLKKNVPIALGGDYFGKTVTPELDSLLIHHFLSNKQLLDLYCRATPQSIFPGRKIGKIEEGYEASFLVLESNPIVNFAATRKIVSRFRKGKFLYPTY